MSELGSLRGCGGHDRLDDASGVFQVRGSAGNVCCRQVDLRQVEVDFPDADIGFSAGFCQQVPRLDQQRRCALQVTL